MIKKLLIFWLLASISSTLLACNHTETELRELNEALSTVPTREELDTLKSKINEVIFIKKFLRSNGFEDPYANFNSVINNFCITTRTGL
jgi:hypothetical protein